MKDIECGIFRELKELSRDSGKWKQVVASNKSNLRTDYSMTVILNPTETHQGR